MPDRLANPVRGEASIAIGATSYILRPSFQALVAAEEELGSLFDLVERAANGRLLLSEIIALFWHSIQDRPDQMVREEFGEGLTNLGLTNLTPPLKILLKQILTGCHTDAETV